MAHYFRPGTSGDIHFKYILLAHIIFVKKQFIFALVCNIVDAGQLFTTSTQRGDSPIRAAYRAGDRFARPNRLTTPRPAHLSVPPLMLRSSLPSVSRGLVYINAPGHTCLDELFIEYEQVTTWEARFSSNKLEANYHVLSAAVYTRWFNGQAHKSPPLQFG